jgi:predicted ABC-type ATPase
MKTLHIIAGANGSVKTTFAKSFADFNDLEINILRVKNRVLNGGHYIPKDDIIRRYHRSKSMFYNSYKDLVDDWGVYYNTNGIFEEIVNKKVILDSEKYNELIKDFNAND